MSKRRRRSVYLHPDDLEVGQFAAVIDGTLSEFHQVMPHGGILFQEVESYGAIKGVPFAILAVNLPFMVGAMLPGGQNRLFDVRDAQFMRVSQAYVSTFEAWGKPGGTVASVPSESPDAESPVVADVKQVRPGESEGGVTAGI